MRDEESSESHDKVPTLLTAAALCHSLCQRLGELFEELSVVSDQIHSLNPLIELDTVEAVCEWLNTHCLQWFTMEPFLYLDESMQHTIQDSRDVGVADIDYHGNSSSSGTEQYSARRLWASVDGRGHWPVPVRLYTLGTRGPGWVGEWRWRWERWRMVWGGGK